MTGRNQEAPTGWEARRAARQVAHGSPPDRTPKFSFCFFLHLCPHHLRLHILIHNPQLPLSKETLHYISTPSPLTMAEELGMKNQKTLHNIIGEEEEYTISSGGACRVETLLRVAPLGLCIAALVVMLRNSQSNDFGSLSYSDLGAFKYLVYANGICASYSLFSAFYTAKPRQITLSRSWIMFFLDQVLTYMILAAGTVSTEILYLAYNGDENVTWSKQCSVFDTFCSKATKSVGITFGAVLCYVFLSLISSYRLFSSYETPVPFLDSKATEIAVFPRP
ncbi:hypothetical protein LUZ60_017492 [Juncus effusus]|nr:hypothetical protein LUZ60_017492 [Juncus effusus]